MFFPGRKNGHKSVNKRTNKNTKTKWALSEHPLRFSHLRHHMGYLLEDVSGEEQRMVLISIETKFLQHLHVKGALYLNAHCCCRLEGEDESVHRLTFVLPVGFVSILTACEGSQRTRAFSLPPSYVQHGTRCWCVWLSTGVLTQSIKTEPVMRCVALFQIWGGSRGWWEDTVCRKCRAL